MPKRPTPRCSRAGTPRPSHAGSFSRRPRSKPASFPPRTRWQTSNSRSPSSMRRWRTRAVASVALLLGASCGKRPAPSGPPPPSAEPELRIGLSSGAAYASLGGPESGELFISELATGVAVGAIPAGARWIVVLDSVDPSRVRLVRPDSSRTDALRGLSAINVTENRFVVANGRQYRGRITVTASPSGGRGVSVVNRVGVESYIAGVVGPEIGGPRPDELAAPPPQAWDAVHRTAGQVLEYDGQIIDAYFHSTCGFSTAGVDEAFATAQTRPYLRPVSDDRGGGHYYCDISPRFRWREEWDGTKLRSILSRTLAGTVPMSGDGLQRITDVTVSRTTRSGRVGELRIVFERGDVRIPGPDVRSVLRPEADRMLASAAFQLTVTKTNGEVSRLIAAGAGSGHAVGMCQWGAIGRARAGQDYREILSTYFPGTKLEKIY